MQVTYFKDIGAWFLPYEGDAKDVFANSTDKTKRRRGSTKETIGLCNDATKMSDWLKSSAAKEHEDLGHGGSKILDKCCTPGKYWAQRRAAGVKMEGLKEVL